MKRMKQLEACQQRLLLILQKLRKPVVCVDTFDDLERELKKARKRKKLSLIEVKCAIGSRQNLGRPTTAIENKEKFMEYLKTLNEYQLITTSLKRD